MPVTEVHVSPASFPYVLQAKLLGKVELIRQLELETAQWGLGVAVGIAYEKDLVFEEDYVGGFQALPTANGAVLLNKSPHASTIEYGRTPGAKPPPFGEILKWVLYKARGFAYDDPDAAAYLVMDKVARDGLPPHRIMHRVQQRMKRYLRRLVEARIGK